MPLSHRFIITIDGAAGTGKSTVAQELARRLGTDCLDTGAMYRAVAVLAVEQNITPSDGATLAVAIRKAGIQFDWESTPPTIMLGGIDISERVRDLEISGVVSTVAKQPEVREVLVEQQRIIGEKSSTACDRGKRSRLNCIPASTRSFFLNRSCE